MKIHLALSPAFAAAILIQSSTASIAQQNSPLRAPAVTEYIDPSRAATSHLPSDELQPPTPDSPASRTGPTELKGEGTELKVFQLVNSSAEAMVQMLTQLYSREKATFVADRRTNAVLVRGPTRTLLEIEAIVLKLEADDRKDAILPAGSTHPGKSRSMFGSDFNSSLESAADETDLNPLDPLSSAAPRGIYQRRERQEDGHGVSDAPDALLEGLRSAHQRAERQASQTANGLRRSNPNAAQRGRTHNGQLLGDVEAAFEARQNLQRAELSQLRERLASIEQSIAARERVKEKIIQNRVAELLDPNLQWEPPATGARAAPPSTPQLMLPGGEAPSSFNRGSARSVDPTAEPGRWPSAAMPGGSLILRSAEEYGRELGAAEAKLQHSSRLSSRGFVSPATLAADERRLKALQAEYAAQLRLLELELQSAEVAMQTSKAESQRAEELLRIGAVGGGVQEAERRKREAEQARVRLEQLKTLYELYRAAGKTDAGAKEKPSSEPPAAGAEPPATSLPSATRSGQGIEWQHDLEAAKRAAAASNRLVLIDVWAPWCHWCQPLEENVFSRQEVIRAIEDHYVPVRLDYDQHRATVRQYEVKGVPWVVILSPDGDLVDQFNTPQSAEKYVERVNKVAALSTPLRRE